MFLSVWESVQAFLSIWFLLPAPIRYFLDLVLIVRTGMGIMDIFLTNT